MFDFFQANQARAAAVLNEFGGVEGFVTMKDVLTFIFGQISGEIRGQEHYEERDEDVYEVPGEMKLTDFNNLTNFGIDDPRMTTIGGVAFRHLDRLPKVGDDVNVEGVRITVLEMEAHRIARVRVARGQDQAERAGEPGPPGGEARAPAVPATGGTSRSTVTIGTLLMPALRRPWRRSSPFSCSLLDVRGSCRRASTSRSPDIAPVVVYPLRAFSLLFYPVVFVFSRAARLAARMVGVRPAGPHPVHDPGGSAPSPTWPSAPRR